MTEPPGEHAKPRRRRGRRRRQTATGAIASATDHTTDNGATPPATQRRRHPNRPKRLPTVHEVSAGGLVIDDLEHATPRALIIGNTDRRGHLMWTMPKGHIEIGERAEQTAVREIAEETGIRGDVLAALGSIDYWFRAETQMVHKTVHHYLLRYLDGQPCANCHEVAEVAWVPLDELPAKLAHTDERRLTEIATHLIETMRTRGRYALPPLPPSSPRRRPQTHSIARRHNPSQAAPPTNGHKPEPGART